MYAQGGTCLLPTSEYHCGSLNRALWDLWHTAANEPLHGAAIDSRQLGSGEVSRAARHRPQPMLRSSEGNHAM